MTVIGVEETTALLLEEGKRYIQGWEYGRKESTQWVVLLPLPNPSKLVAYQFPVRE